ncbi:MAG: GTP-binding protein, partial [Candidatus Riflebacteria bacterium]|nr:GTP-binding protein [Candidatus Riflebacteria bacterium]
MPGIRGRRPILPIMLGTAGHVDHGKTALVRNLTGRETDTLPEEKRRELSIDLGFAPFVVGSGCLAGIIDVPGHEDFIRNMVAGAVSMDAVILTVAADDGVMPQTVEHLQILGLLEVPRIVVAITKSDLADEARLARVQGEVAELLRRSGPGEAPIVPGS